ncbi:MAG: transcriptional repressor [Lentisphaerae bacterium]|nr:transcriptional repressor [Lentisphaerota bacterium]
MNRTFKQRPAGAEPEAVVAVLRRHGIRMTHQRMEVYREVTGTGEHPDAETVYRRVKRRVPAISLDTVYRTLNLFERQGLIGRVGATGDRTRFDANVKRHHHFVCMRCGRVTDFYSEALDAFSPPREVREMGHPQSLYVEVRGICKACTGTEGDGKAG